MTGKELRHCIDNRIAVSFQGRLFMPVGFTYIRRLNNTICSAWLQEPGTETWMTVSFDEITPEDDMETIRSFREAFKKEVL